MIWMLAVCALPSFAAKKHTLPAKPLEIQQKIDIDPFTLAHYVNPLLEKKKNISILEIGPAVGEDVWELFADLPAEEKQKISYDGVELWLEEEPKDIKRKKSKKNSIFSRTRYFYI